MICQCQASQWKYSNTNSYLKYLFVDCKNVQSCCHFLRHCISHNRLWYRMTFWKSFFIKLCRISRAIGWAMFSTNVRFQVQILELLKPSYKKIKIQATCFPKILWNWGKYLRDDTKSFCIDFEILICNPIVTNLIWS